MRPKFRDKEAREKFARVGQQHPWLWYNPWGRLRMALAMEIGVTSPSDSRYDIAREYVDRFENPRRLRKLVISILRRDRLFKKHVMIMLLSQ